MTAPLLIIGYGNPSRGDDALGPEFLNRINGSGTNPADAPVDTVTDFQLQIEHALDLRGRRLVLFVDASVSAPAPFSFERLTARRDDSFTTHALSPQSVLAVYREIDDDQPPPCFLLSIRGYEFDLGSPLTPLGTRNLEATLAFWQRLAACHDPEHWMALTGPEEAVPSPLP